MKFCGREYDVNELMEQADDGNLDAMTMLVTLVYATEDKEGLESAEKRCVEYIKKLAKAGDIHGYVWMADALVKGSGVKKNIHKAIEFYQKAAEAGDSFGYECIGEIYYKGEDVPVDYDKAYEYFAKAETPSSNTLFYLGEMFRLGNHFEKNIDCANKCYRKIIDDAEALQIEEAKDMYYEFAVERLAGNYEELTEK
jgi:TPR repeat protein